MFKTILCNILLLILLIFIENAWSSGGDVCSLPIVGGCCSDDIKRFAYNRKTKKCERFTYTGCGGNDNNFGNLTECQNACMDVCSLPAVVGPCKGAIPRYAYKKANGKCEPFSYGGCDGNANNFETLTDCQEACADVCSLPIVAGPCKAYIQRYGYRSKKGRCEKFIYGGCKGNANNFKSLRQCQNACACSGQ